MFGHHDVVNHDETVTATHLFQSFKKQITARGACPAEHAVDSNWR